MEKKGHPAKQVFQAIRIEVNDELAVLERGLEAAINMLDHYGRLCVISFNSLEDRIVKNIFRKYTYQGEGSRTLPSEPRKTEFTLVTRKVINPSKEEIEAAIAGIGKEPGVRGETLTLEEFAGLADELGRN